ncbi:MAG: SDR family oxidoreductase [Planctomycetes bacterium]|nr:SDR family oxidoreductase [Planctomycetota bacterium]
MRDTRCVLITGAGSGIGWAAARRFAAAGDRVYGVDLKFDGGVASALMGSGGGALEADVADFARAGAVVDGIVAAVGRLDVVVLCAGIARDKVLWELSEADWDRVLDVDLKGVFNYLRAAAPTLRTRKQGKVIAVSSTAALRGRAGLANYAAAKAGILGLVRVAARELGRSNVNVNAVLPGFVETALTAHVPDELKERARTDTALGRVATPDDVASVIFFLASEDARHIAGEAIRVDGGLLA